LLASFWQILQTATFYATVVKSTRHPKMAANAIKNSSFGHPIKSTSFLQSATFYKEDA